MTYALTDLVLTNRFENASGRFLFEFLDDHGSGFGRLGFEEQVKVLGHQDPANEQAVHLLPHFFELLDETLTEAGRTKDLRPAVSAAGDELQFTRTVSAMVDRHSAAQHNNGVLQRKPVPSDVPLRDIADPQLLGSAPATGTMSARSRKNQETWPAGTDLRPLRSAMSRRDTLFSRAQSSRSMRRTDAS